MNFFTIIFLSLIQVSFAVTKANVDPGAQPNTDKIVLSKSDHIIAEHLVNMIKFTAKGYVNTGILSKVIT